MNILIDKTDFENIRQVAKHCTYDALEPYIRERQNIDFIDKLGNAFYFDIAKNPTNYTDLLGGCEYTDCNGNTVQHFGLKRVLIHLSYAAYVIEHGYTDTPFGVVQKMHDDSMPVPMAELRNLHDRNRRLGNDYFATVNDYLCHNADVYPLYSCTSCECKDIKPMATRRASFTVLRKNKINKINNYDCKDKCE